MKKWEGRLATSNLFYGYKSIFSIFAKMIRTVITPSENKCIIILPDEYIGRKIEISLLAMDEVQSSEVEISPFKKYKGIFKFDSKRQDDFNQHLTEIRNEWE